MTPADVTHSPTSLTVTHTTSDARHHQCQTVTQWGPDAGFKKLRYTISEHFGGVMMKSQHLNKLSKCAQQSGVVDSYDRRPCVVWPRARGNTVLTRLRWVFKCNNPRY